MEKIPRVTNCEMPIKNVVKTYAKTYPKALNGSWLEVYDGVSFEKDSEIIAYKKLK